MLELGLDSAVVSGSGSGKGRNGKGGDELPEHGIRTGDIVRVGELPKGGAKRKELAEVKGRGVEGVVTRVGERAVWVALGDVDRVREDDGEVGEGRLWV